MFSKKKIEITFCQCLQLQELFFSVDSWHVAYGSKRVNFFSKVVQVYISILNKEMIDSLRQLNSPSTETARQNRKISGCHTKRFACLMGENSLSKTNDHTSFMALVWF